MQNKCYWLKLKNTTCFFESLFSGSMFSLVQTWDDLLIIGSFSFCPILWGFDTQGFDGLNVSFTTISFPDLFEKLSCLKCGIFSNTLFRLMVNKKALYSTTISRIPSPWSHSQKVGNYRSDSLTSAFGTRMSWNHKASNRILLDLQEVSESRIPTFFAWHWKPPHISWSSSERAVVWKN